MARKMAIPHRNPAGRIDRPARVLIAGLGNLLMGDDGVGVHVVELLQAASLPRGVLAVEIGTGPMDALHLLEWADEVLAVDAVAAGGVPGTIYRLNLADVLEEAGAASLHELGLRTVCRMIPPERRPVVTIYGVEPAVIDFGVSLSPAVEQAVPELVRQIRSDLDARRSSHPDFRRN